MRSSVVISVVLLVLSGGIGLPVLGQTRPTDTPDTEAALSEARDALRARTKEWAEVEAALQTRLAQDQGWVDAQKRLTEARARYNAGGDAEAVEAKNELIRAEHAVIQLTRHLSDADPDVVQARLRLFQAKRLVKIRERDAATRPSPGSSTAPTIDSAMTTSSAPTPDGKGQEDNKGRDNKGDSVSTGQ